MTFIRYLISIGMVSHSLVAQASNLDISDVLTKVGQHQPVTYAIQQAEQQAFNSQIQQQQKWLNPSIEFGIDGTGSRTDEMMVALTQPIDVHGVNKAKQQLTKQYQAQANLNHLRFSQAQQVAIKAAFYHSYLQQQTLMLLQDELAQQQQVLSVSKKKFEAGRLSAVEVDRVKLQLNQAQINVANAKTQWQLAKQQLAQLWGGKASDITQLNLNTATLKGLSQQTTSTEWLTQWYEQQQQLTQQQKQLVQQQTKAMPSFMVGMRQQKTYEAQNDTNYQWLVGLSMPIPIFNRNQAGLASIDASAQLTEQRHQLYQQQLALIPQKQQLVNVLAEQWQSIQQNQLPMAKNIVNKMLIGFDAGKFSVLDIQQAQQDYLRLQQQSLNLQQQWLQASITLEGWQAGITQNLDLNDPLLLSQLTLEWLNNSQSLIDTVSGITP